MTDRPIRLAQPRRWRSLLATLSVTVAAAPALGDARVPARQMMTRAPDAQLWTVQAEGGEAGESGAVVGASEDVAYLAQLSIVEGHLLAAGQLYARGEAVNAIGLSYHPEAEMMDEMRARLVAHGAADFTPRMQAFSAKLEAGAPQADVDAALAAFRAGVAAATAPEAGEVRDRFDAMVLVLKAAAAEYAGSLEGGKVGDVLAWQESYAFVQVARSMANSLQADDKAAHAAARALTAMQAADEAFGDATSPDRMAADPAILLAVAAQVELIASSVR